MIVEEPIVIANLAFAGLPGTDMLLEPGGLALESLPGHLKSIKVEPMDASPPRKRQRLDHLTQEEKVLRRKLKNRVAAQNARDRKKAQMDHMEDEVTVLKSALEVLRAENECLLSQNETLKKENDALRIQVTVSEELQKENNQLRQKLAKAEVQCQNSGVVQKTSDRHPKSLEYASLINTSQQKKQDLLVTYRWMMLFIGWMMLNQMNSSTLSKSSSRNFVRKVFLLAQIWKRKYSSRLNPKLKWWGPKQNSWNPSEN